MEESLKSFNVPAGAINVLRVQSSRVKEEKDRLQTMVNLVCATLGKDPKKCVFNPDLMLFFEAEQTEDPPEKEPPEK